MKTPVKKKQNHYDDNRLSRIILLTGEVEQESVSEIIQQILEINAEDDDCEDEIKTYVREPIKIIINSFGGSVYDGLGLIDCIDESKTPVHTICYGAAMSMALVILASGHERFVGKFSTLMYHETAYGLDSEKIQTHKQEIKEADRLQAVMDGILLKRTKLTKKSLEALKQRQGEMYMAASEAIKHKIADQILDSGNR